MSERKELRNLQLENVRLETELNEASQRLEEQQIENQRNESQLQSEMSKLIDNLRDEKVFSGETLQYQSRRLRNLNLFFIKAINFQRFPKLTSKIRIDCASKKMDLDPFLWSS